MSQTRRWVALEDDQVDLANAGVGQKLAVLAIFVYFVAATLAQQWGEYHISLYLAIWGVLLAVQAVWVGGKGLQLPLWGRIVGVLCVLVPFANAVILLSLSFRTTKVLRDAGYDVGLFGAR